MLFHPCVAGSTLLGLLISGKIYILHFTIRMLLSFSASCCYLTLLICSALGGLHFVEFVCSLLHLYLAVFVSIL